MRIISEQEKPNGTRRVLLELAPGEGLRIVHREASFYRLGEPCTDQVMPGHVLAEARRVAWCPVEQTWRDA